jgi:dUTP pyrophosphatase
MKIVNKSNNPLPSYSSKGSSGLDIRAWLPDGSIIIKPGERALVRTGLQIDLIRGFELQIRSRSGLAINNGIIVLNGVGTIDSDFKDEIKVILYNAGTEDFTINSGDRIAQMVLIKVERLFFDEVEEIDRRDDRGGGFGHTGVN